MSLRGTINQSLPRILSPELEVDAAAPRVSFSIGLVQSSLMCIDVLARNLGGSFDWSQELGETIAEIVQWTTAFSTTLTALQSHADEEATNEQRIVDCLKLLGSSFLCGGTICGALGPRSLKNLGVRQ